MTKQNSEKENDNSALFAAQRIYVKDLSLESPKSPEIFKVQNQKRSEIKLDLGSANTVLHEKDGLYEVVLSLTVTAMQEKETIFVVEIHQAGIFAIRNVDQEVLKRMLGSFCLNFLFPYARHAIDQTIMLAGFPPIMIAPLDFETIYEKQQAEKQEETFTDMSVV